MIKRDDATQRQVDAACPRSSTWLSANAGSGKTRVLTDRVARLLLEGVEPQKVLCLTYTKAAASEMQNRLFARLGGWAMLPEGQLRGELERLGAPLEGDLSAARTLFARAIETPGGLKIQTIHSFCASLLRRFPLEAGVSPQFREVDENARDALALEVLENMASGPQRGVVAGVLGHLGGNDLSTLLGPVMRHRAVFQEGFDPFEGLGIPPDTTDDAIAEMAFSASDLPLLTALLDHLPTGTKTDQKAAQSLAPLKQGVSDPLAVLEGVFLTKEGNPSSRAAPGKGLARGALAAHMPALEDWIARIVEARQTRLALRSAQRGQALQTFAASFLPRFAQEKQRRGWLDFDDLIHSARHLLSDPGVAAWVLYRLDGGIDHILVDEAQDTSPTQWDVIEKLAQEFTSGQGARDDTIRTVFVVGDKKQSIYSFQGADAQAFDRMRSEFAARLAASPSPLHALELEYSFRSAPAILQVVDEVFAGQEAAGFEASGRHIAFRDTLPGRVDLWPMEEKQETPSPLPWYEPQDQASAENELAVLARRIAVWIRGLINAGAQIPEIGKCDAPPTFRPVHEGDFLLLVSSRTKIFHHLIRACKAEGLNVAGADRLRVGAEMAVRDLMALLRFLAMPEDSYSLACALRSPLFGWSEDALYGLAAGRGKAHLWQALRARGQDDTTGTLTTLQDLRDSADFLRPYELLQRILLRHGGRKRLIARLGTEAEDGLDALLSQAMQYEQGEIPSLTGFLDWADANELVIKRELGGEGRRLRVMTIHGAKGLEAPIVVLPETGEAKAKEPDAILPVNEGIVWTGARANNPDAMQLAKEQAKERLRAEQDRLLYVAMTRAEKWLVVAGSGAVPGDASGCWHSRIRAGLEQCGALEWEHPGGVGLRYETGAWAAACGQPAAAQAACAHEALPDWLNAPIAPVPAAPPVLLPSDLGGAKALAGPGGREEAEALALGTQVHHLLEHLPGQPEAMWAQIAERLGASDAALAQASGVLKEPQLAALFGPDSHAEITLSGWLDPAKTQRAHGTIDRLIMRPEHGEVLALDIKTNATLPSSPEECPEGILRQMGAYAALLSPLYPEARIRTAILWTCGPLLMPLPTALTTAALGGVLTREPGVHR